MARMFGVASGLTQQALGELSPPYDGSEMDDLFPDLAGLDSASLSDGFNDLLAADVPSASECMMDLSQRNDWSKHVPAEVQGNTMMDLHGNINTNLTPESSNNGNSVIKVMVTSTKDENNLVNLLLGKEQNKSTRPVLTIIKKIINVSSKPRSSSSTANCYQEIKADMVANNNITNTKPVMPSYTTTDYPKKMSQKELEKELQECDPMNRNAIAAKLNRLRKKNHVGSLEESVNTLQNENTELRKINTHLQDTVSSLETEVSYLKSILANQSSLSSLLSNIQATKLQFHTSMDFVKCNDTVSSDEKIDVVSCDQNIALHRKRKRTDSEDSTDLHTKYIKMCNTTPGNQVQNSVLLMVDKRRKSERIQELKSESSSKINTAKPKDSTKVEPILPTAGICLHVSGENVSLEFCPQCSRSAQQIIQMNTSATSIAKNKQ